MNKKIKLAQFLWTGLAGTTISEEEEKFLTETPPGAVILFTRNYESPKQLWELNKRLQEIATTNGLKKPFIIGIDMEGGRVQRLKEPFTVWPSMRKLGDTDSTTLAFDFAKSMGKELRAVGINFNFSPCTDTILNDHNDVIGDRSFSSDHEVVGRFASSVIRGFKKENILTCIKHFPGHGYTALDSHDELPVDERKLEDIHEIDAFKKALRSKPEFIMPAHIMFPEVDPDFPATLSETWTKDILKEQFNCRSFLISDDLDMGALDKYGFEMMVKRIYNLGFHQLLFCHGHEKAKDALELLDQSCELDETRLNQILDLKDSIPLLGPDEFNEDIIGHEEHKKIAEQFK
ncbi:MAG: beta-N-acetylhexosaminidase [Bdellovibrionales bacterium]